MKKTLAMSSLFLALALGSCSSDEPDNNGGTTGGDELGYVAVNIVQPSSTASRGFGEGDFENGEDIENIADEATFFVFNKDGELVGDVQNIKLDVNNTSTNPIGPAVEKIYGAVVVINGVTPQPNEEREYQLVCVLNAPSGLDNVKTLTELKEKYGNYRATSTGEDGSTLYWFTMTNSVYKEADGTEVLGAIIGEDNIKKNAEDAKKAPVEIYVERVVAKIEASPKEGGITVNDAPVPNTERTLYIDVNGIEIANIASSSYLFKRINDFETNYKNQAGVETAPSFAWVWDANNKRSYWETVSADLTYENQSYNDITNHSNLSLTEYVQPNTNQKQKTAVLVTARLVEMNGESAGPADLAYIRGQYTTDAGARAIVAQAVANKFDYHKKVGEGTNATYVQLSADDFEWVNNADDPSLTWLARYEVVAKLKKLEDESDLKIYTVAAGENGEVVATEVTDKTALTEFICGTATVRSDYTARIYTDGMCYYFVNIDQTSVANGNRAADIEAFNPHKFDGVVRNHIYRLTLESIGGIGVPVFDPSDVIIPEIVPDEELYYVAARINVLDWKVVTQGVNFQGK